MNKLCVALGLFLLTEVGAAQEVSGAGYIGLNLGQFSYEEDLGGLPIEHGAASGLYGGYRFGKRWSFEGSTGSTEDLTWFTNNGPITANWDVVTVMGIVHAKAFYYGFGWYDADLTAIGTVPGLGTAIFRGSESGFTDKIGGQWQLDGGVTLRVSLDGYAADNATAFTLGGGIAYRF